MSLSMTLYPLLSAVQSIQETFRHDKKFIYYDLKHQHKQTTKAIKRAIIRSTMLFVDYFAKNENEPAHELLVLAAYAYNNYSNMLAQLSSGARCLFS